MSCGAAVLTTDRLALPEVGGDAVAYTGIDAASIGRALAGLLDAPDRRRQLAELGRVRAAEFSWAHAAAIHAEVYRRAARSR
jgi:glycosyltransferase involved in cell wall biosynthesis